MIISFFLFSNLIIIFFCPWYARNGFPYLRSSIVYKYTFPYGPRAVARPSHGGPYMEIMAKIGVGCEGVKLGLGIGICNRVRHKKTGDCLQSFSGI